MTQKVTPIQTNFTAGELSPRLEGRVDLSRYYNGAIEIKNYIVQAHGGATRRPGTKFVSEVKDSSKKVRLIPFQFSEDQTYIIEMGHQYMRFYRDGGQLLDGGSPVEIVTPYTESELFEVQFAQSADVVYMAHRNHPPQKLSRTSDTNWSIDPVSFTSDPFSANNYPRAVALYEERSVWGGSDNNPQKLWFSKTNAYENMTTGTNDDDAMTYTIASDQVNHISWLSPGDTLLVGTIGGEFEAHGGTPDTPITPNSIQINRQTNYGSKSIQPIRLGYQLLFIQRQGRKIRELAWNEDIKGFRAQDMTILAEHITRKGVIQLTYQQEPDSVAWGCRNDGTLIGFTREAAEEVYGWHRHFLGGTNAKVESIATIPVGDHDQMWVVVSRTIDGSTKRYVEYMMPLFDNEDAQEDAFFVDSGLTYDGAATTSVSGLDHLEGEEVTILADGATHPKKTVSSGSVTLDREVEKAHIGLAYNSRIKTMRLDSGAQGGSQGRVTRVHKQIVRFFNTLGAYVGPDGSKLELVMFRQGDDPMDSPPDLFSGDKVVPFPGDYTRDPRIVVTQNQPLPSTILALMPEYHYER